MKPKYVLLEDLECNYLKKMCLHAKWKNIQNVLIFCLQCKNDTKNDHSSNFWKKLHQYFFLKTKLCICGNKNLYFSENHSLKDFWVCYQWKLSVLIDFIFI